MPIVFPANPTVGQTFTAGAQTWEWDGSGWNVTRPTATGDYLRLDGGTITGPLTVQGAVLVENALGVTGPSTLSGKVTLGLAPVDASDAATKAYVDAQRDTRLTQAQGDARYLRLAGGTVTGALAVNGNLGTGGNLSVAGTAGITGQLTLGQTATQASHAANKQYVDVAVAGRLTQTQGDARYLTLSGGTMTGHIDMGAFTITSNVDPALATQLARKAYVDAQVTSARNDLNTAISGRLTQTQGDARYLELSGGTMTGTLNMASGVQININVEPTQGFHAARKNYVDGQVAGRLTPAAGDARYVALAGTTAFGRGFLDLTGEAAALQYISAVPSGRFLVGGPGMVTSIGNLTDNRIVSMGTPGSITADSENLAQGQTHTHFISAATIGILYGRLGLQADGATIYARNQDGPARGFGQSIAGAALRVAGENGGVSTIGAAPSEGGTWVCCGVAPVGFSTQWKKIA